MRNQLCLIVAVGAFAIGAPSAQSEIPAFAASRFVDSIGVCTHWSYPDTPYGFAYETVKKRLLDSGIRHIRDGWHERFKDLGRAGIQATLVVDVEKSPAEWVSLIKEANADGAKIVAIEGPNEPDLFWANYKKSYQGKGHAQGEQGIIEGVIAFQKDLYESVKRDPATASITVIGPSLGKTYGYDKKSPFGSGTLSSHVDWGNFHPYPGGNAFSVPFGYAGLEKYIWHGGHPTTNLDEFPYAFDIYQPPFAPKPMAATETGYSTFSNGPTELAHSKYLPRLYAEYFRKGIQRTYTYEFVDEFNKPEEREANFGLLRHDSSPKPAYNALRRLIHLSGDRGGKLDAVKPLAAVVEVKPAPGFTRTEYVHHLALQRSDGSYLLLLWHEIALDDTSQKPWRRLPLAPAMPATVKLAKPALRATIFIPNDGESPVRSMENVSEIELQVPDRIMVLQLDF